MLTQREKIKSEDMKDVLSVSIPKSYLQAMYQHMEQPEIRIPNSEVQ